MRRRFQYKLEGVWAKPDAGKVRDFFREPVAGFIGASTPAYSIVRGEEVREDVHFDSIEEWLASLAPGLKSAEVSFNSPQRTLWFSWTFPDQLYITASVDESGREAAQALIEAAGNIFPLGQRGPVQGSSMSGTYRSARMPDAAWVDEAIRLLESFSKGVCTAGYRLAASPQFQRTSLARELRGKMSEGKALIDWSLTCGSASIFLSINGEIRVNARSESDEAVLAFFSETEKRLGLTPVSYTPNEETKGVTRRAFLKNRLKIEWFDRLVPELVKITGEGGQITGRLRTVSKEERTFHTLGAWRKGLEAEWDKLAGAGLWQTGPNGSVNIDVDLRREMVTAIFNLRGPADVEAIALGFESALELKPAPENVYRYRKFGRTYHIDEWLSNREYADAVERAVKIAFDTSRVEVTRAFIEARSEHTASVDSFQTVEEFAEWFRRNDKFQAASLLVEGIQGRSFGIHIIEDRSRFQIFGNLSADVFDEVDKQFKNSFLRSDKKDTGEEKPAGSDSNQTALWTAVTALAVAAIGTCWNFVSAHREPPTLEIDYPEENAEVQNPVVVGWTYMVPHILGPPTDPKAPATVELWSVGKNVATKTDETGTAQFGDLRPGSYTLFVKGPTGLTKSRHFKLAAPTPTTTPRP